MKRQSMRSQKETPVQETEIEHLPFAQGLVQMGPCEVVPKSKFTSSPEFKFNSLISNKKPLTKAPAVKADFCLNSEKGDPEHDFRNHINTEEPHLKSFPCQVCHNTSAGNFEHLEEESEEKTIIISQLWLKAQCKGCLQFAHVGCLGEKRDY